MSNSEDSCKHDCDEALTQLYHYLDSELDDVSSERIRSHLEDCGSCDQSFDFERRLKMVVRERLDEEVPQHLVDRVREAIEAERTSHS